MYVYPKFDGLDLYLGRVGGPGLGNHLFTWARAVILADRLGGEMVYPTWPQLKPARLLRRDPDQRSYADQFRPAYHVAGLKRLAILLTSRRIDEASVGKPVRRFCQVIETCGMGDRFRSLTGHNKLVAQKFYDMLADAVRNAVSALPEKYVSVHVRLGDFGAPASTLGVSSNTRMPLTWYIDQILQAKQRHGDKIPIFIFSDGTNDELAELLQIPGVSRVSCGSPAGDIYALSRSTYLIGSASSFSMWAAYLGQMDAVFPNGTFKLFNGAPSSAACEADHA